MAESKKTLFLCSERVGTLECAGVQFVLEYSAELQCLACDLSKLKLKPEQMKKIEDMVNRTTRLELREV